MNHFREPVVASEVPFEHALDAGQIVAHIRQVGRAAEEADWRSYDPFDLLLSPVGETVRLRSALAARLIVQMGKRSGSAVRALAGAKPHEEPKVYADFISAYSLLGSALECRWARERLPALCERLAQLGTTTAKGPAWGLSFPYASRFVSVAAGTPNAYTTISCVSALASAGRCLGDERLVELAVAGARTIVDHLGLVRRDGRTWFRYWPDDDACIINVHALIAAAFGELGRIGGDERLVDLAQLAARTVLDAQRPDGSFPYALDARGRFVDAFHTGFVLEGLTRFQSAGGAPAGFACDEAVRRGMHFLRSHLISGNRLPRAFAGRPRGRGRAEHRSTRPDARDLRRPRRARPSGGRISRTWADRPRHASAWRPRGLISLRWDVGPIVLAGSHLASAVAAA